MLVAIDFRNTLIVDVSEQPQLLQLLTSANSYIRTGWGSDCTFKKTDDVPEVVFIKDSQVIGDTDHIKKLEDEVRTRNNDLYRAQQETRIVQQ